MRPARKQRIEDAKTIAFEAGVSKEHDDEAVGLARIASWGFFA